MADKTFLGGQNISFWIASTEQTRYPEPAGDISTDVLVIGAGLAGITTASLLREAGKKVVLVDAGRIAEDVTGNTTAKITVLHGFNYQRLFSSFGMAGLRAYIEANKAALGKIVATIQEKKIDCEVRRQSAYTYTRDGSRLNDIKRLVDIAKEAGLPAFFTRETPLPFDVQGAICLPDQAQFHPRRYLLSLANDISGKGSFVFENTKALDIREEAGACVTRTNKGSITAEKVVMATHFPFYDPESLAARLVNRRSYVLAVKLRSKHFEGVYYGKDQGRMLSLRGQSSDGGVYVLVGGQGHLASETVDPMERYASLEKETRDYFDIETIDYYWNTQDNDTRDGLPYIGRYPGSDNVYTAIGFGGWGMTNGTLSAMIISDDILGIKNPWADFFDPKRALRDSIREDGPTVENGQGKVIDVDGKKIAVYKDEKGGVHSVTAVCTHMGCIVNWNSREKTWDCPCHGSRYSVDGKVLRGPAEKDLEESSLPPV